MMGESLKPESLKFAFLAVILSCSAHAQLTNRQPAWYLPVSEDCRLFVQEFGGGQETIVVVHGGWGAEHSYLLDAFKGVDLRYRLVFYDQRGSLLSPCPTSSISVDKHVEDLERLRKALGLERLNIVAHSMGTFLAMSYLQQHLERVKGLVLLGAVAPKTPTTDEEKAFAKEREQAARQFLDRPEIAAEQEREIPKDKGPRSPKEETNFWRIKFAGVNIYHVERWREVEGGRAFYNADAGNAAAKTMPTPFDFTPALKAHQCPIWVMDGDHDFLDMGAVKFQRETAAIATVHFSILQDAGHSAWIDAPEQFQDLLLRAIDNTIKCR